MKLPRPRKIIAEKYVAGLSLFKSVRSPIKLSANESALGPSPKAVKSYNSIGKGFLRYPDSDGTFFRKVLAKKFHLDKNRIILGSGSDQIFELVCKLFLTKNDEAIVSEYGFVIYRIYSRICGAKVKYAKEDNFRSSVDSILNCVTRKTKIVFTSSGAVYGKLKNKQNYTKDKITLLKDSEKDYLKNNDQFIGYNGDKNNPMQQ